MFHAIKRNPPVHANLPPVAGALAWCRALMERVKQPMDCMLANVRACVWVWVCV